MNRDSFRLYCAMIIPMLFGACGAGAVYRYYTPRMADECYTKSEMLGKLGKDGWPDLPMTECQAAPGKAKCAVELLTDHFAKDTELKNCRQQLQDCQKGLPPG